MTPALSVVVPTHDTCALTLRCLEALARARLGLAGAVVEVLLVDDFSGDGTAAAVRRAHPGVRILALDEARGFAAAANQGLAEARGELLLLLNSDTEVEPGALAALAAAFARNPSLGVAGASLTHPGGRPQWSGGRVPTLPWLFALASGLPRVLDRWPRLRHRLPPSGIRPGRIDWVSGAALAIRRTVWLAAGPLDEGYRFYGQDLDLCVRVRDLGWEVAVIAEARVMHHLGATVGKRPGAVAGRFHPALAWVDLVRFVHKRHGTHAARRAARALELGSALQVALRSLAVPLVPAPGRPAFRADTRTLAHARTAVRQGYVVLSAPVRPAGA